MAKYVLKYMFDWCSGTCLWSINQDAEEKFGYPIDLDELPLSENLRNELNYLIDKHDEALDWKCPSNDLLWSEQEQSDFIESAKKAYHRVVNELSNDFEIELWEHCLI